MIPINQNSAMPPALQMQPNPDVIVQRMGDEIVLLHLQTNHFYELNRTAAKLWELLSAGHELAWIQEQMLCEFDVDAAQLASEIQELIMTLKKEELVITETGREIESPPASAVE